MENEIKNEIKVKTKYWHECRHCSRQHRKIKKNYETYNRSARLLFSNKF